MVWLTWIATVIAVMIAKAYTVKQMIRLNHQVGEAEKRVSKLRTEHKVAHSNLEVTKRSLSGIKRSIDVQKNNILNLDHQIAAIKEHKEKEAQESKKKLGRL